MWNFPHLSEHKLKVWIFVESDIRIMIFDSIFKRSITTKGKMDWKKRPKLWAYHGLYVKQVHKSAMSIDCVKPFNLVTNFNFYYYNWVISQILCIGFSLKISLFLKTAKAMLFTFKRMYILAFSIYMSFFHFCYLFYVTACFTYLDWTIRTLSIECRRKKNT